MPMQLWGWKLLNLRYRLYKFLHAYGERVGLSKDELMNSIPTGEEILEI